MKRHLLRLTDLTDREIMDLIDRALQIKRERRLFRGELRGYTLGLLFEKVSTRTRLSFEVAMFRLGGNTIYIRPQDTQLSRDESIKDTAIVLSLYLDALAIRTYSQRLVEEIASYAKIPVINALTDSFHPCQILSDLMTVTEKKGDPRNLKIAWVGDGNNVANTWIHAAMILGFPLQIATPKGYEPERSLIPEIPSNIVFTNDPCEAVRDADVINTDVWVSMGQEGFKDEKIKAFEGFRLGRELLALAKEDAIVMHCLPAHRGQEITDEVMDGPNSAVFLQAENKLYMHQAILKWLLL